MLREDWPDKRAASEAHCLGARLDLRQPPLILSVILRTARNDEHALVLRIAAQRVDAPGQHSPHFRRFHQSYFAEGKSGVYVDLPERHGVRAVVRVNGCRGP